MTNLDTADLAKGFSKGMTHTGLKSISPGATKHLVDAKHMPWMDADPQMETFLTTVLDEILVARNTSCFKSLRGELFSLTGNQMHRRWEHLTGCFLHSSIIHTDLRVGDTTTKPRLWIRLVLTIAVAASRSASHFLMV